MFAAFDALGLIEPVSGRRQVDDEEAYNVVGLHTIDQREAAPRSTARRCTG